MVVSERSVDGRIGRRQSVHVEMKVRPVPHLRLQQTLLDHSDLRKPHQRFPAYLSSIEDYTSAWRSSKITGLLRLKGVARIRFRGAPPNSERFFF